MLEIQRNFSAKEHWNEATEFLNFYLFKSNFSRETTYQAEKLKKQLACVNIISGHVRVHIDKGRNFELEPRKEQITIEE